MKSITQADDLHYDNARTDRWRNEFSDIGQLWTSWSYFLWFCLFSLFYLATIFSSFRCVLSLIFLSRQFLFIFSSSLKFLISLILFYPPPKVSLSKISSSWWSFCYILLTSMSKCIFVNLFVFIRIKCLQNAVILSV